MHKIFKAAAAFLLSSVMLTAALAAQPPQDLVESISQEVIETARNDPQIQGGNRQRVMELVRRVILPHVDFERMTSLPAGRY